MHRVIGEGAIMDTFLSDSHLMQQGVPATKKTKRDRSFMGFDSFDPFVMCTL